MRCIVHYVFANPVAVWAWKGVPTARVRAEPLYVERAKCPAMATFVLYLLMQAFGAMLFAYFTGILAMRERRAYMALLSLGMYLIMVAALIELWGDRSGWTPTGLGLYVGLVSTAVASIGAGCFLREIDHMEDAERLALLSYVLVIAAAIMGAILALGAESSDSFVRSGEAVGRGLSGGYTKLGATGWALGSPLFIGAILVAFSGLRAALTRDDGRGFWLLAAGVLFLLWPFDLGTEVLPLTPTIMLLALAMTYLGFQPSDKEEEEDGTADDKDEMGGEPASKDEQEADEEDEAPSFKKALKEAGSSFEEDAYEGIVTPSEEEADEEDEPVEKDDGET